MSIEQLGESLLADATKKRKREQRKAKRFTGALLGIQAANYFLRNKAKKRAETFLASNTGLINQRAKQFNEGVGFWSALLMRLWLKYLSTARSNRHPSRNSKGSTDKKLV